MKARSKRPTAPLPPHTMSKEGLRVDVVALEVSRVALPISLKKPFFEHKKKTTTRIRVVNYKII